LQQHDAASENLLIPAVQFSPATSRIDQRGAEKISWRALNRLAKHSSFCLSTIKSNPHFALAATNYPPLSIDNLAQMLTAFGTTSHVS
jgi:hypothetical protein